MEKFLVQLLGSTDLPTYAAAYLFALMGAIVMLLIASQKRDKLSETTPYKFNFLFLIRDNFRRLLIGLFITFFAFRFADYFFSLKLTMWLAVLIGAFNDQVVGIFEKFELTARK
jgi:hypothetical protein